MCCTYLIRCWSNTKRFLSILVFFFFLESVFILKNFRKSKKISTLLFDDSLISHASLETPVISLLRMFHNSLAIETSSREKHLERFSKFLGFGHFRDYFASGSLVTSLHREFRDSLVSGCPSCKKRLRQNFQNFLQGFLATRFGNLLVGYMSCENHVFCTNRVKS